MLSLYVHVPFCRTRCSYCAFNTYARLEWLIEPYLTALRREIELAGQGAEKPPAPVHTIYLGGGTPSLLKPQQVSALITACDEYFALTPGVEISLEANPGTVDLDRLQAFRAAGVSRLSIGVQSAQTADLKLFRRGYDFEQAAGAFRLARKAGYDNISVDLIYGAPGQTRPQWRDTLGRVLSWGPEHVSLYSLTLEPDTLLQRQVAKGLIESPDPDLAADMYDDARERLHAAGLRQYEISNWARPGYECRHNRQYWLNEPYVGFGAGAYSTVRGLRYWNITPIKEYITRIMQGKTGHFPPSPAVEGFEVIDDRLAMAETLILGLRLVNEGVGKRAFAQRFGRSPDEVFGGAIADLANKGLVINGDEALCLTERAYLISNQVFMQFLPVSG